MHRLICAIQPYDWGKLGSDSKVALYKAAQDESFSLDASKKYAELWMGSFSAFPLYFFHLNN